MSPAALGRHLGMPEGEATAFLAMLVREGKVAIRLVELTVLEARWQRDEGGQAGPGCLGDWRRNSSSLASPPLMIAMGDVLSFSGGGFGIRLSACSEHAGGVSRL
jgi:hypothetical protein